MHQEESCEHCQKTLPWCNEHNAPRSQKCKTCCVFQDQGQHRKDWMAVAAPRNAFELGSSVERVRLFARKIVAGDRNHYERKSRDCKEEEYKRN